MKRILFTRLELHDLATPHQASYLYQIQDDFPRLAEYAWPIGRLIVACKHQDA